MQEFFILAASCLKRILCAEGNIHYDRCCKISSLLWLDCIFKGDQKRGDHSPCFSPCGDGGPHTGWTNLMLIDFMRRKKKRITWQFVYSCSMERDGKGFNWLPNQGRRWWWILIICLCNNNWLANVDYICILPDGAWALWGDISGPQIPHERLISCHRASILVCLVWKTTLLT